MSDEPQDTPISRAIKRRKELQDAIKASMKELEKIDNFLRMYRLLSAEDEVSINRAGGEETPHTILGRAGMGQTQPMFEHLALAVIREAQRPMQSGEIIEAFRARGHPIGGNETRTAWNRLWQAKERGVLVNIPRYGYWPADEPLPEKVMAAPPPKRKVVEPGRAKRDRGEGRPVGRQRVLTDAQIKTLEGWLAEGKKTRQEMARDLGGISLATINNYRLAWLRKARQQAIDELSVPTKTAELDLLDIRHQPQKGRTVKRIQRRSKRS